jgi:hypothetical protein
MTEVRFQRFGLKAVTDSHGVSSTCFFDSGTLGDLQAMQAEDWCMNISDAI